MGRESTEHGRWPQVAMAEMAQINKQSKWLKELQRYMEEYNILQEDLEQNNNTNIVENQLEKSEGERVKN